MPVVGIKVEQLTGVDSFWNVISYVFPPLRGYVRRRVARLLRNRFGVGVLFEFKHKTYRVLENGCLEVDLRIPRAR